LNGSGAINEIVTNGYLIFVLFLAWGLCIALACFGFGWLTLRLFGSYDSETRLLAPGIGLGVLVFTGSVLNLSDQVKGPVVITDVLIGTALFLFGLVYERKRTTPCFLDQIEQMRPTGLRAKLGFVLIAILVAVRIGAFVLMNDRSFNGQDDSQAYLAFPLKMLANGSFAPDPFSERRIQTTLGGMTYLQAVALAPTGDLRILNLVDGSIGLAFFSLFAVALCRRFRLSVNQSLWVLAVLAFTPDRRVNSTSVVLPAALLLLLALIWLEPRLGGRLSWRRLLLFSLVAGTACTLKSTAIPSVGFFTFFLLATGLLQSSLSRVLRSCLVISVGILAMMLPWMIDSNAKCGTPLYPLLGHGFHVSSYVRAAIPVGPPVWLRTAILLSLPLLATAIMLFRLPDVEPISERQVALAAVLAGAVMPLLIGMLVREDVLRYSITTIWAVNVITVAYLLARATGTDQMTKYASVFFTTFALTIAFVSNPENRTPGSDEWTWLRLLDVNLLEGSEKMPETAHIAQDRAMQQSIPAGAILLARTDESYGFDFRRNPLWIADYPGSASLPPGMPLSGDPQALDRYLLDHSIRYVAYSYANDANFPYTECVNRTSPESSRQMPWMAREAQYACVIQEDLVLLSKTHRHLFDDGRAYVLDLE
jgi:hypothetical protein